MFRHAKSVFAALAVVGLVAGACGGGGSKAPAISDPNEIITRSVTNLENVKTVHVEVNLSGQFSMAALGGETGGLNGSINLANTTVSGDIDIANQALDLKLSVPGFLGTTGEIIVVDKYMYTKISLQGDKFTKSPLNDFPVSIPTPGASPSAIASQMDELKKQLEDAGAKAELKGTEKVEGKDAYHVSITVPVDKLNQTLASEAGDTASGVKVQSASIDYWVYTDEVRPAKLQIKADAGSTGNVDVTAVFSNFDAQVTIKAPDSSQIQQ